MTHTSTTPRTHSVRCMLFDVGNTLWKISTNDESELLTIFTEVQAS